MPDFNHKNEPLVERDQRKPSKQAGDSGRQQKPGGGFGWFFFIAAGVAALLVLLLIIGSISLWGRGKQRAQTSKAVASGGRTVTVVKPSKSPASFEISLPGSAEPLKTATLYARVNGYLKARQVDIGDYVKEGQLLAEIDAPDIEAQLNQSRAQAEQSRAAQGIALVTYQREKRLLDQKVVSQQEFDQSEAAYNQAVANVKAAEANVANLGAQQGFEKITAPFDGVITTRFLDDGALISSGGGTSAPSIFTLSQIDVLRVYIFVPQPYVANVHADQQVEVTAAEYPQKVFRGTVSRVADSLDPIARTERVEIQIPSENGALLAGMYLSIRLRVEQAEPALIVPSNTVDIRRDGPRVAVVGDGQKLEFRPVKLGRDFGKTIEILAGLNGDESLVVNPSTDLADGEHVEVQKDDAKSPPK